MNRVLQFIYPIPEQASRGKDEFYREWLPAMQRMMRGIGLIGLVSCFVLIAKYHLAGLGEVRLLTVMNLLLAAICTIWAVAPARCSTVYRLFFWGMIAGVILNSTAAIVAKGSTGGLDLLAVFALIAGLMPWPTGWIVALQLIFIPMVLAIEAVVMPRTGLEFSGSVLTVLIACLASLVIHGYLTQQRFQNFLHQREVNRLTRRLQRELELARQIQLGLLPPQRPAWPGLDVVCHSQPARTVGGDFYSYFETDSGVENRKANGEAAKSYVVSVGDTSGKGVGASLLMATTMALLNSLPRDLQLVKRLLELDRTLTPNTKPRHHICALCCVAISPSFAGPSPGTMLRVVNAGCIPPYLCTAAGEVRFLELEGFPLGQGLSRISGYRELEVEFNIGDVAVLVSDGVIEAVGPEGELFGFDRFADVLAAGPRHSAVAMLDHLLAELALWAGDGEPQDDLTIVVIRREHGRT